MAKIPERYRSQKIGASGYRIVDIDLDGVCADYTSGLLKFLELRDGLDLRAIPEPDNYNLAKSTGWPFRDSREFLDAHREAVLDGLYSKLPIYPGVSDALKMLSNNHVHIRIVTHRLFISGLHRKVVNDTSEWLDKHNIPFMSLCFLGVKDSLIANLHIDDSPSIIEELQLAKKRTLIFDQPYNQDVPGERMYDWDSGAIQILNILDS